MDGNNFWRISGLEKLSQDRTVSNSAAKACSKLFKPTRALFESKIVRPTDSQTKALFIVSAPAFS